MDPNKKHLFTAITITDINTAHTRISIFSGVKYPHAAHTLGNSGSLVIDTETAPKFVARLQPLRVTFSETAARQVRGDNRLAQMLPKFMDAKVEDPSE